ncbi:MAG: lipolytic enzyme, G-D-S-L [Lawsonibacter sp.]|nr:lipolytic enzyme, G-D-S-L [Lawsonibacter sp.]
MKKHILCLGDSNTHGYCADPSDCADGGIRFNEEERWTCLLQKALGEDVLVTEEGLSGRTTVFPDPLHESMDALGILYALLKSHEVLDLLVIMLGTNDTKERLGVNASCIAIGMERLVRKAQSVDCWGDHAPNILIVCPPPIRAEMELAECGQPMGKGCLEKSRELPLYLEKTARLVGAHYLDAAGCEFNALDGMHLTRRGHAQLAQRLAERIPGLLAL